VLAIIVKKRGDPTPRQLASTKEEGSVEKTIGAAGGDDVAGTVVRRK
jgi:hypothetical protein